MAGPNKKTSLGMSTNVDKMKDFEHKVGELMKKLISSRDEAIRNVLALEKGYSDVTYQNFKEKFKENAKRIELLNNHLKATSEYYRKNAELTDKHLSTFFNL